MLNYFKNILCISLFLSIIISSNSFKLKKNITSLLNTTDIQSINDKIIISTNGGIYEALNNAYSSLNDDLYVFNISQLSIVNNNIWLSSLENGMIQILDSDLNSDF